MSVQQFNSFSQKFIFFIFRFIGLPLFLWAFLSLPALYYAAYFSKLWKVFDNAYVNLNFNFVFVILGVFAPVYYFFNKSSRIVFPLILLLLFLIRFFDVGLKSTFQISFSPIVFRSTSIDSFFIALDLFGKELTLVVLVGILCGIVISYLMGMGFRKTRTSLITLAIFLLLSVRSSYILYNERYYAFEKLPSYLLAKELFEYQDSLKQKHITISQAEIGNLKKIGITPKPPDLSKLNNYTPTKNVVILYLESFNTNYTKKGGSNFENLTPNIDLLLEKSVLFTSYFNAVSPTHNSIYSSLCGIFPELNDNFVRENPDYTKGLICFSDVLYSLGYTQNFYFGHGSWYGGITLFLKNHNYNSVTELSDIERENPAWKNVKHEWGIQDTDLSRYVTGKLEELVNKQPFNIGIFFINTHPPYYIAPDCPGYSEGNKHLQAIHCVDHAVGIVLKNLVNRRLMDNTVVVLVGDTPGHDHENGQFLSYNKVMLAIYSPDLNPGINKTFSYTPDLGPTMLEVMGIPVKQIQSGHSIFSSRKNFTTLIAPEFTVIDGKYNKGGRCSFEDMEEKTINFIKGNVTDCERRRIFQYLEQWLNDKDTERTLTMNE
jgi:phosphoglycerol transferase MdoB-like AlkP superfamily enzyme